MFFEYTTQQSPDVVPVLDIAIDKNDKTDKRSFCLRLMHVLAFNRPPQISSVERCPESEDRVVDFAPHFLHPAMIGP